MQKIFIILGIFFIGIGLLLPWLERLHIGTLPGDIFLKRNNIVFYFPLTTSIILSVILSLVIWLIRK